MNADALGLEPNDAAPLVAIGADIYTRSDVRALGAELLATIRDNGVNMLMTVSDNPLDILKAIWAAEVSGSDLYIAHTSLAAEHIDTIIGYYGVQLVIGAETRLTGMPANPAAVTGNIFMMTSGTTGAPKIAAHKLSNLLSRARSAARPGHEGAKWLLTYQPTGFAGLQVQLTAVIGRGLVVAPAERTPAGFARAAAEHGVTQISATPTFWRAFLMLPDSDKLSLKQITLGGEAADQSILDRVARAFPSARVTHIYASTEAGVVFSVHDGKEGFPAEWLSAPVQGVDLKLVDGFLHIRTPNSMRGYVSDNAQPLAGDGWLATADRVELRDDRAFIVGRDDSTINVGGSKVYPLMVEQFLLRQPGVAEARVFGVPSPIAGSLVAAEIVVDRGEDPDAVRKAVLAACREGLATYQAPRILKVVDAIAVRQSGKKG